jgi:regulatory protein
VSEDKALSRAKGLAYRYLAARPRSKAELRAYLAKKEVPEDVACLAEETLSEYGYIDDAKFALQFARYARDTKGLSRYALKMELKRKGVSDLDIEAALGEIAGEGYEDEEAVALRVAERKVASMKGVDKERARRRLTDHLRRKGFGFDLIRKVAKICLG